MQEKITLSITGLPHNFCFCSRCRLSNPSLPACSACKTKSNHKTKEAKLSKSLCVIALNFIAQGDAFIHHCVEMVLVFTEKVHCGNIGVNRLRRNFSKTIQWNGMDYLTKNAFRVRFSSQRWWPLKVSSSWISFTL